MCFKRKPPIVPIIGNKVALLFGINNYPGSSNDLNGCLNDIADVEKKLNELYPSEWSIKKFSDSQVTRSVFRNEIKNQIRRMRFERGEMTQQELADKAGVTRQTILAIEAGKYSPSLTLAFKIARAFNVKVEDVFQYEPQDT